MQTNRTLVITLAIVSAALLVLLGLLENLAATYIADALKPYAPWVIAALGVVFLASLAVLIWQLRAEDRLRAGGQSPGGPSIEQNVDEGGQIIGSPPKIAGQSNASIRQTATDKGRIENSGPTIE